jgi:hypothetical protein
MKIDAKISISVYEEFCTEEKLEEEKVLREKLQPYIVGDAGIVLGDIYRVDYPSEIFSEILKFADNKEQVHLMIEYLFDYSEEELAKARMFLLNPKKFYNQSKEYNEYPCDACGCRILKNNLNVGKKIKGGTTKRIYKFGEEIEELICLSVDLYNAIIEKGVNSTDFSPVYCGKELQAYAFTPQNEYRIISNNNEYKKCDVCGREYGLWDPDRYDIEQFTLCGEVDFSEHDVLKTDIYYEREQRILLSPKLYNIIKDYINSDDVTVIF